VDEVLRLTQVVNFQNSQQRLPGVMDINNIVTQNKKFTAQIILAGEH